MKQQQQGKRESQPKKRKKEKKEKKKGHKRPWLWGAGLRQGRDLGEGRGLCSGPARPGEAVWREAPRSAKCRGKALGGSVGCRA